MSEPTTDKPVNCLQPPRRHLVYWFIGALILVLLGAIAVVLGLRMRASNQQRMAIFTIHKIVPAASGTIYMEHDVELVGDNLTAGIAIQRGSSVVECLRHAKGPGSEGLLGIGFMVPGVDHMPSGKGSFMLGDCPRPEIITTPLRIELKPGQRHAVATCRDKSGAKVELYVHCDDM
jgi:hypothetical protein